MDLRPHSKLVPITVVAVVIHQEGRVLVTRRFEDVHLGGMWDFPGGKVEKGESMTAALIREIREELDVRIEVGSLHLEEKFEYEDRTVRIHFFDCRLVDGTPRCLGVADLRWVDPSELDRFKMPAGNARLIEKLKRQKRWPAS